MPLNQYNPLKYVPETEEERRKRLAQQYPWYQALVSGISSDTVTGGQEEYNPARPKTGLVDISTQPEWQRTALQFDEQGNPINPPLVQPESFLQALARKENIAFGSLTQDIAQKPIIKQAIQGFTTPFEIPNPKIPIKLPRGIGGGQESPSTIKTSGADILAKAGEVVLAVPPLISLRNAGAGLKSLAKNAEVVARNAKSEVGAIGEGAGKGDIESLLQKYAEKTPLKEGKRGSEVRIEDVKAGVKPTTPKPEAKPPVSEVPSVKEGASGVVPPTKPPVPPVADNPIDDALNKFGKAISGEKSEEALAAQSEIWAKDRATRSARFSELLAKEQASGVDARTAIQRATAAFKGEYVRTPTGLTLPSDVVDAAYNKIIKVIGEDATIPPAMKSFEIASTKTALDNALAGKPIPNIAGIKGGSAKSRLLRIFDSNPEIKKIITNPEEMQRRLLASKANPQDVDAALADYLRNLPSMGIPMSHAKPSEFKTTGFGTAAERERSLTNLKLDLANKPQNVTKTDFPQEPLLTPVQQPLIPEQPSTFKAGPFKTQKEIDQATLDLILELSTPAKGAAQIATPVKGAISQPILSLEKFSMLPPTARETVIKTLKNIGLNIVDALGIPKAVKFAFDMSMMTRQLGISGARHPVSWLKTWKPYFQAMKSDKVAFEIDNLIRTEPDRMNAIQKLGLDLYDIKANATYWDRPETMASKLAEKYIPGVRMSNRGAGVAVNYFVTDVGKQTVKVLDKMKASPEEYKVMGSLLNELAGRGEMPNFLKGTAGDILNKLLSSPRYTASRFEWPVKLFSSSKAVRQEAWSTLFAWAGVNAAILGMGVALGGSVEGDPRSSEVIKLRIGNKRIDLWQGSAQILRMGAQLAPYVDARGNIDWTMGSRKQANGRIVPVPRGEILARFAQSKESPGIGAIVSILTGKNYVGEKINLASTAGLAKFIKETFAPASAEEIGDAYALEGLPSAILSTIGLSGVGVNTYGTTARINSAKLKEIQEWRNSQK